MNDDEQHEAYGAMRHAMTQHVSHRASDEIANLRAEVERLEAIIETNKKVLLAERNTRIVLKTEVGMLTHQLAAANDLATVQLANAREWELRAERLTRERNDALKERGQFLVQSIDAAKEISWLTRERDTAVKDSDWYRERNTVLAGRAEAAERQVATLREALRPFASLDLGGAGPEYDEWRISINDIRFARAVLAETETKDG